jgi:secreted PhoX family phosphatase
VTSIDRRQFLRNSAKITTGALIAPSLSGLLACAERIGTEPDQAWPSLDVIPTQVGGYGPLVNQGDLALPSGFSYVRLSLEGTMMADGHATPGKFDGMAAFQLANGHTLLIRNHENKETAKQTHGPIGDPSAAYDTKAAGGTTSLEISYPNGVPTLVRDFVSLNGTLVNCAGGPTPWGTWLSCEETTQGTSHGRQKKHGYVFEVDPTASGPVPTTPIKAMGRFSHEAVAIDPATGIVYLTEDTSQAGFYRFLPNQPGNLLAGGTLQGLRLANKAKADLRMNQPLGTPRPVSWVTVPNADPPGAETNKNAVYQSARSKGAAMFTRLEGCWYGDQSIYFVSKYGGNKRLGQVWRLIPATNQLVLVYESTNVNTLDGPGNLTVSPRGGLVLAEDGSGTQYVRGIDPQGNIFPFALNTVDQREFCGVCFSPNGQVLFVNVQGITEGSNPAPSRTYAIWGPWGTGNI